MKKKILSASFVVAMAAIAGYNTYVNQPQNEMSDLALANVEALAGDENTSGSTIIGNCLESVVLTSECKVICFNCKNIWYPSPRVPKANAYNVSGSCTCGKSDWSDYND